MNKTGNVKLKKKSPVTWQASAEGYKSKTLFIIQLGDRWEWVVNANTWLLYPILQVLRKGPVPGWTDEEREGRLP